MQPKYFNCSEQVEILGPWRESQSNFSLNPYHTSRLRQTEEATNCGVIKRKAQTTTNKLNKLHIKRKREIQLNYDFCILDPKDKQTKSIKVMFSFTDKRNENQ